MRSVFLRVCFEVLCSSDGRADTFAHKATQKTAVVPYRKISCTVVQPVRLFKIFARRSYELYSYCTTITHTRCAFSKPNPINLTLELNQRGAMASGVSEQYYVMSTPTTAAQEHTHTHAETTHSTTVVRMENQNGSRSSISARPQSFHAQHSPRPYTVIASILSVAQPS